MPTKWPRPLRPGCFCSGHSHRELHTTTNHRSPRLLAAKPQARGTLPFRAGRGGEAGEMSCARTWSYSILNSLDIFCINFDFLKNILHMIYFNYGGFRCSFKLCFSGECLTYLSRESRGCGILLRGPALVRTLKSTMLTGSCVSFGGW